MDKLYCLSSGVPAKPKAAAKILKAVEIGCGAMEAFITGCLIEKNVLLHYPVKQNKLKTFATSEVNKSIRSSSNKLAKVKAERNILAQLILLTIQNEIDLERTLSYPLYPETLSLETADGMPVKMDKAKLLHCMETNN
ncbi:hypothetical protein DPMN_165553 [Dreissena polymorpha]|uniref:Uncharacterized protein n=1 Tax=Dreissena polymorpha TaxID=45954 RepID=A0A9D4IWI3_DREPO|nr:hypothetical protein DPMN_165553 [Dreissena polymorpha]